MMDFNALDIVVPAVIRGGATQLGKVTMEKIQNLVSPWLEAAYARLFARYVQTPDEVTTTEKKTSICSLPGCLSKIPNWRNRSRIS